MPDPDTQLEATLREWAEEVTAATDAPSHDSITDRAATINRRRVLGSGLVVAAAIVLIVAVVGPWNSPAQEVRSADPPDQVEPALVETGRSTAGSVVNAEPGLDGSLYVSSGVGIARYDEKMQAEEILEPEVRAQGPVALDGEDRVFAVASKPGPTFVGDDDPTFFPTLVEADPAGGGRISVEFNDEIVIPGGGELDIVGSSAVAAFDETVYRIDLETDRIAATVELEAPARQIVLTSDAAWVSTAAGLYELDLATLDTRQRLPAYANTTIAAAGGTLFAAVPGGGLFTLDEDSPSERISDVAALALVGDGDRMWVFTDERELVLLDVDGTEVHRFDVGGDELIVAAQGNVIWTVDLEVGTTITRYEVRGLPTQPPTDTTSTSSATTSDPETTTPTVDDACPPPQFVARSVPDDFLPDLRPGSGGQVIVGDDGTITPLEEQPPWNHFRGPPGVYVDVLRGEANVVALTGRDPATVDTVEVLGTEGREVDIHEGFGIVFELGPDPCDHYLLAGYGIDREALAALARDLEPAS